MPTNPFEDEDGRYFALINDEGQYSLWPAFADVPDGWTVAHGEESRKACLAYIEEHWTDMRPKSLIEEMKKYEQGSSNSDRRKSPRQKVRATVVAENDAPAGEPAVVGS